MCAENSCQRPQNLSRINCLSALNVIEWIDMVKQTRIYVFQLWIDRLSHSNVCIIHIAWKCSHFGIFLQNSAVVSISYFIHFKFNSAVYWLGGAKLALISCKIDCVFSMSFFTVELTQIHLNWFIEKQQTHWYFQRIQILKLKKDGLSGTNW